MISWDRRQYAVLESSVKVLVWILRNVQKLSIFIFCVSISVRWVVSFYPGGTKLPRF